MTKNMKKNRQVIRKEAIRDLYQQGYTIKDISSLFDLSRQYVWQVIHRQGEVRDLTESEKTDILSTEG